MIEIDLHVEASLDKEDILFLARKQNVTLPDNWYDDYLFKDNKKEYLSILEPILPLMQRREAIEYIGYAVVKRANKLGINYAEFVFTPSLHNRGDLDQAAALNHFLKGVYRGLDETPYFRAGIVLGILRTNMPNEIKTTYELVKTYRFDNKVMGLCLYGENIRRKLSFYDDYFAKAREDKIPFSIDVCSNNKLDELTYAIELGAKRINVQASFKLTYELMLYLQQHQTVMVFSPSYLLNKGIIASASELPMLYLASRGIRCTIASGYNGMLDTNLVNEYRIVKDQPVFKKDVIGDLLNQSISASFACEEFKAFLVRDKVNSFDWFYSKLTNEEVK